MPMDNQLHMQAIILKVFASSDDHVLLSMLQQS